MQGRLGNVGFVLEKQIDNTVGKGNSHHSFLVLHFIMSCFLSSQEDGTLLEEHGFCSVFTHRIRAISESEMTTEIL